MAEPRIIKKYPNRRLYDTEQSCYITLTNVKELVMAGVEFQVVDSNSSDDITRTILLQIIMEEESQGKPLFSESALSNLIRFYGGTFQGVLGKYLEESLVAFSQQQQQLFSSSTNSNPMQNIAQLAQQNMKVWTDMQSSFFQQSADSAKDNKKK
ncbi:polyhydroxyalkanoate synthesis repressor PhaR [Thalassotalea sp. ND16A]|uniref:polyhydroxyalkanoate synthesis repressor PhaR n=1 Tax=Thalassotalea sp. ND16A TaxID=1535422 RepID=UPI00051A37AF|nr:polyhydroxyalkanoate synthesis repressor PhaR [Thalassotalea sp. ND16A]KGJ99664.1 hypothetical protein ND16A_3764 [Thalassotalea sp. ND16A]